jgi:diguanylate cyclase (GGDEF)-like protein
MDPLAGLPNADDFQALLAREELRRARTEEVLTVAMIDVDGLRTVNRQYGAGAGSEVLRVCVEALRSTLRSIDELARTGPDEFAILLHATDVRHAAIWEERFADQLQAESFTLEAGPVTCAVGLSDTADLDLLESAKRAHRRMEVMQTMRKLKRSREPGIEPGAA